MHKIIRIIGKESWRANDKTHSRTHAILDDGSEVVGYSLKFDVGDKVESFWDERWQVYKMRKPIDNDIDVVLDSN